VIGIFKQKNPANLFVLLVTGILIRLPVFMQPHQAMVRPQDGVFFKAITRFLDPAALSFPLLYPILAYLFLFIQAVIITRFINNQRMTSKPTYLPGLAYLLITALLPEWNYFSAPLLINTILLFILSGLFGTYNKPNALGIIFNIGLALGIAGLLFIPSLIFIAWAFLALAVMRPFRINEWLICLLGITTPFYFYAIYLIVTGTWNDAVIPSVTIGLPAVRPTLWLAGSIFLLTVPFLAGGYYVQQHLRRMLINVRKGWSLLLLFLLTALLLLFINTGGTVENWIMGMVPLAAFHGYAYLYAAWRPFALLLFWLTVAFIIYLQYSGPGW
jgi:hypothetical protein